MAELPESYSTQFDTNPMTVKDWFITIFILAIPVVGIVMDVVWAFASSGNLNRRNFCRASLLWIAVGFAILFAYIVFFGGMAYVNRSYQ